MQTTVEAARQYKSRGWAPLPLQPGQKRPNGSEWQHVTIPEQDYDTAFAGQNIGVLLGTMSGNLYDVDLDNELTVKLAPLFLPPTDAVFGRRTKPQSHYLYRAPESDRVTRVVFKDIDGVMLAEIRGNGHQTMMPPSTHPSGEAVEWAPGTGEPTDVPVEFTERGLGWTCAAAMLVRAWDSWSGSHHDLAAALAGGLVRAGVPAQSIETLVRAVSLYAGDHEPDDRLRAVWDTVRKYEADPNAALTGFPTVREIIGGDRVQRMLSWMQLPSAVEFFTDTDSGNANRFVDAFGLDVRFVHEHNAWFIYDGTRWNEDKREAHIGYAREIPRRILADAARANDEDRAKQLTKWALQSQNVNRIFAIPKIARTDDRIAVPFEQLDADPYAFNVQNGTINLRTGGITPHERRDLITKLAPVTYNPRTDCPMWLRYLDGVFAEDAELIEFAQRCIGYSLTGSTKEQVFFLLYGPHGTGKTTFIETLRALFGDYGANVDPSTLMQKQSQSRANPELARLVGIRFASTSESEANQRLAAGLVKRMSGNTRLTVSHLYAEPFEFDPCMKLWIDTNYKPRIDSDDAVFARLILFPFNVQFRHMPNEIKGLRDILKSELPGILRWAIDGCLRWQLEGLGIRPAKVSAAVAEYQAESDAVALFIDEACLTQNGYESGIRELYSAYKTWCDDAGERPLRERHFRTALEERGFRSFRNMHGVRMAGIRPAESPSGPQMPSSDGVNPFAA